MVRTIASFSSLFLATLLLLVGSGLFNTYVGLRLTAASVSEAWVGAIIAAYYLGLVFGARVGHKLIIRVGHIRAYAATAAVVTVTVLIQAMIDFLPLWIALRFVAGIAMVTQFIVLESWLNEQTENHLRGRVFAFYMVFSSLGTVLGQLSVGMFPALDTTPLMFVALCSAACLIPVAVTRRVHPAIQVPVPLHYRYYVSRVPMTMTVLFMAGMMSGAFYGLAPVYGVAQGMDSQQVAVFVAAAVASGLLFQWPVGWLADRISRVGLIRVNSVLLAALTLPLWGWWPLPYWLLVVFSCLFGIILFTLYPVAAAFANDNVEPDRRVGLSAILYMVYGLGACVGPMFVGLLMRELQAGVFFVFVTACAVFLIVFVRPQRISGVYLTQDAPTEFVPMPDSVQNPNVVPALDPRVDTEIDVSFAPPPEEADASPDGLDAAAAPEAAGATAVADSAAAGSETAAAPLDAPGTRVSVVTDDVEATPSPEPHDEPQTRAPAADSGASQAGADSGRATGEDVPATSTGSTPPAEQASAGAEDVAVVSEPVAAGVGPSDLRVIAGVPTDVDLQQAPQPPLAPSQNAGSDVAPEEEHSVSRDRRGAAGAPNAGTE